MSATKTTNILAEQFELEMQDIANRLDYGGNQLNTITRTIGGGVENVDRMEFNFRERRLAEISVGITANAAVGATTVYVENPGAFHRDVQVYDVDGDDMFYVDEDIGGTANAGQVKVRGKGGSGGITTALTAGELLLVGPESHAEGEDIPPAFANVETNKVGYCFQSDETIKLTDIAMAEGKYGVEEIIQQRRDKAIERLKRINIALYKSRGGREILSAAGARRHAMTGLNEYLEGYTDDASALPGGLTLATIGELVRPTTIFDETAEQKAVLVGQNAQSAVSAMPATAVRAKSGKDIMWGVSVSKLVTAFGTLNLVYDPLLSQENGMQGEMYVLSTKRTKQVQLRNTPIKFMTNVQNSTDIHNQIDVYTGTLGLRMANLENSRRITGI
jgi:hypothetical protein